MKRACEMEIATMLGMLMLGGNRRRGYSREDERGYRMDTVQDDRTSTVVRDRAGE